LIRRPYEWRADSGGAFRKSDAGQKSAICKVQIAIELCALQIALYKHPSRIFKPPDFARADRKAPHPVRRNLNQDAVDNHRRMAEDSAKKPRQNRGRCVCETY
jgi:hypothetical protein